MPAAASQLAFARVATAFAVFAVGALSIGALAVGRLAIKRLTADEGRFRRLSIDELEVGTLRVRTRVDGG